MMKIFKEKRERLWILLVLLGIVIFYWAMKYCQLQKQDLTERGEPNPLNINWLPYSQGLAKAKQEDRYILIDFYTDWCGYCKKMDRETYSQEEVKKILAENFVTIKVNAESENNILVEGTATTERELALKYKVNSYPTIWFLDSNSNKIAPLPGFVPAEQFLWIINYIGGGWYKKISFEEYLRTNNLD